MTFFDRVYDLCSQIPLGRVTTYGHIAALAGNKRMARQVGWALHVNKNPGAVPCHRVLNRFGGLADSFAFGGKDMQRMILESEGVLVGDDYTVDLKRFLWEG